jgi:hypothetical protein
MTVIIYVDGEGGGGGRVLVAMTWIPGKEAAAHKPWGRGVFDGS